MEIYVTIHAGKYVGDKYNIVARSEKCEKNYDFLNNHEFCMVKHETDCEKKESYFTFGNDETILTSKEWMKLLLNMPYPEDIVGIKIPNSFKEV